MFEKRELIKISEHKTDEVTVECVYVCVCVCVCVYIYIYIYIYHRIAAT